MPRFFLIVLLCAVVIGCAKKDADSSRRDRDPLSVAFDVDVLKPPEARQRAAKGVGLVFQLAGTVVDEQQHPLSDVKLLIERSIMVDVKEPRPGYRTATWLKDDEVVHRTFHVDATDTLRLKLTFSKDGYVSETLSFNGEDAGADRVIEKANILVTLKRSPAVP
jgi:hypothetical protein